MSHISKGMKRARNIYDQICAMDNLMLADNKARRGKGGNYGIIIHDRNRTGNIERLRFMLLNKTYRTSEYSVFKIYEPKEREVYRLPYYPDRITHHAILNLLEPLFVSWFTADTYCCIKKRGIHAAAIAVKRALKDRAATQYCLKLDIRKFYPNVDHAILKELLRRKIKDARLLWLLDEIISSAPGLPIGNYLSQFLANFYLTGFDHWLKETMRVRHYFRYCDDLVILAADKPFLHNLLAEIKRYLGERLKLEVKANYQVFPVASRGIDFVGYKFYHTHTLLRKSIKKRFFRMLHKRPAQQSKAAYMGWCKHANTINLINTIMNQFGQFGIKPPQPQFSGDKIRINKVLGKKIVVHRYKIEKSKYAEKGNGMLLTMEITFNGSLHILFTGSVKLQAQINDVSKRESPFPFETIIINDPDSEYGYLFT